MMEEHWESGYDDARRTLAEPEVMRRPDPIEGVRIFEVCKGVSNSGDLKP
jgi:NTE family protein